MKSKLKKFFKTRRKNQAILLKDIQEVFKYTKKNDIVVFTVGEESLVITYDYVELGTTDGEWFHIVMNRTSNEVTVVPGMSEYLLSTIKHWYGDIEELYNKGLNLTHPLYIT